MYVYGVYFIFRLPRWSLGALVCNYMYRYFVAWKLLMHGM